MNLNMVKDSWLTTSCNSNQIHVTKLSTVYFYKDTM